MNATEIRKKREVYTRTHLLECQTLLDEIERLRGVLKVVETRLTLLSLTGGPPSDEETSYWHELAALLGREEL